MTQEELVDKIVSLIKENGENYYGCVAKMVAKKYGYFGLWWSLVDIKHKAKEDHDLEITDEQAKEVADYIEDFGDCEYGITWIDIENAIEEVLINQN